MMRIKGFTLTEVIINMAVMLLVITLSGSMVISGMNIFFQNSETLQQKNITDAVLNFIAEKLMFAENISTGGVYEELYLESTVIDISENGQLLTKYSDETDLKDVFGDEFYSTYSTSYVIEINNNSAYVKVHLYEDSDIVYTASKSVILLNHPDSNTNLIENTTFYLSPEIE